MNRFFEDKEVATSYFKYRPQYSAEVATTIVNYLAEYREKPFQVALDVGCGSGQFTRCLAPHFDDVLGIDVSPAQIDVAKTALNQKNVSFRVGPAEDLPVPDSSVDLISSATASHYFDWSVFGKEVDRVLKPNGCLAILGYDLLYLDHPDDDIMNELNACIESYVDYVNNQELKASTPVDYEHVKERYTTLPLPFADQKCMDIDIKYDTSVTEFIECLKTFAVCVNYLKDNPESTYFMDFQKSIMTILGGDDPDTTIWLQQSCLSFFDLQENLVLRSKRLQNC